MSAASLSRKLTTWFEHTHDNPPAAFNPAYEPCLAVSVDAVAKSMEADKFYDGHTRIECAEEFRRRLEEYARNEDTGYALPVVSP